MSISNTDEEEFQDQAEEFVKDNWDDDD